MGFEVVGKIEETEDANNWLTRSPSIWDTVSSISGEYVMYGKFHRCGGSNLMFDLEGPSSLDGIEVLSKSSKSLFIIAGG